MNQQKLESALWRACLHIARRRNASEEMTEQIADSLYDEFLKGSENDRLRYELKKGAVEANEQIAEWPKWKREWMDHYWEVNKPYVEYD